MEPSVDSASLAATLLEASPDGLLLVDSDGTIRLANRQAGELFGMAPDGLVGTSVDGLVPAGKRATHAALRARYEEHPSTRPMGSGLRLLARHADGSLFPVEISLSPVVVDGASYTIATVRDVTDRRETVARLALSKDRERIARDIHDMVIQRVFAAGMSLQAVDGLIESPVAKERIASVTDDLDDVIRQLRQAIFQLGQDGAGRTLTEHVTAVVEERSRHLGFTPVFMIDGSLDDLPEFVGDQLVATLTEALSNVARHAEATGATIEIERTASSVALNVHDDGVGLRGVPRPRSGLSNMMWRAAELGGSCSVEPGDPHGTVLAWTVPLTGRP